jgi:uncharacterized protein (TIGR02145 family)
MKSVLVLGLLLIFAACSSKVTDVDGNEYRTVRIGEQTWMAENLRATHYRDGSPIPQVPDPTQWAELISGAWASYDNNALYIASDGMLYNGYAVNDPRGLCPEGWRIPTDEDWSALAAQLGGDSEAGGRLKSVGSQRWTDPNTGATDESGFGATPGGYRYKNGQFDHIGSGGYWWSSTTPTDSTLNYRALHYDYADMMRNTSPVTTGYSVRCVRE